MHILVINDDGPPSSHSSPFVHSFVVALQTAGHVVSVVLPDVQRSWIGKAHIVGATVKPSYFRPGTLHKDDGTTHSRPMPPGSKGEEWVLVDGTPASCAQIGLHHVFQDRGPVDLVVSGPNYGRNTTAVFALSSGTLGGAMEAAVCRKKAIALSYAFFDKNHDPEIIAGASRITVKIVEHLYANWGESVDLYSINVPLLTGVEDRKIMYTDLLQNYWSMGSCFQETEADEDNPEDHEEDIRLKEGQCGDSDGQAETRHEHKHKHFKWAPKFKDVSASVEASAPGNDGWAIKEGFSSVTALKANFMHASGFKGELKLAQNSTTVPAFHALIDYQDPYVQPLILAALSKVFPSKQYSLISSIESLPSPSAPFIQICQYESIDFPHTVAHPLTSLTNAYIIRKALIRKHYLASLIRTWLVKNPTSLLSAHTKPAVEFELDYAEFLDEALVETYELHEVFQRNTGKDPEEREWWILKPGMSERGQGIRLFSTEEELQGIFEEWADGESDTSTSESTSNPDEDTSTEQDVCNPTSDASSPSQLSFRPSTNETQPHPTHGIITSQLRHFIAQPYIHPPLLFPPHPSNPPLLPTDTKFHIRTYVLATGALKIHIYHDMLALFAPQPYQPPHSSQLSDLAPHLTNTCLQVPGPSGQTVHRFWALPHTPPFDPHATFAQIRATTAELFLAAARANQIHFQPLPNAFEVFGLDFLLDARGTPFLLEVNAFPDFAQTGPELRGVVAGLWEGVVKVAVGGFFAAGRGGVGGTVDEREREERERWGMWKVLELDLGRR